MKIDINKGRYWDRPWSLVDGCTPCSPGCDRCWSAAMTKRFAGKGRFCDDEGNPSIVDSGGFTGEIRTRPDRLDIPLRARKPTVWAVWNDLFHELDIPLRARKPTVWAVWNDLFHEAVQDEFIFSAFSVMARARDQIFLVLTKRVERMVARFEEWEKTGLTLREGYSAVLPNVYLGLTVCNQAEADEKIPVFLQVPGKKFLSIEPMLGPVDLHLSDKQDDVIWRRLHGGYYERSSVDAVILGGETGPGARPTHPDWVRNVRDQCAAAGVPFFFKQWGSKPPLGFFGRVLDGRTHDDLPWVNKT